MFIDHPSVLSSSCTSDDLHDFFPALVHICLNAYDEEWSGYFLNKTKKRKRNEDGEDDFEHGMLPRIPKKKLQMSINGMSKLLEEWPCAETSLKQASMPK